MPAKAKTTASAPVEPQFDAAGEELGQTFSVDPLAGLNDVGGVGSLEFRPCVVIGLGGTGINSVRRAKGLIRERLGRDIETLRYLFVDADRRPFLEAPGLPKIDAQEQCFIGGQHVEPILRNHGDHKWIWDQLPELDISYCRPLLLGDGCGQIRPVGRFAMLASHHDVVTKVRGLVADVSSISADLSDRLDGAGQRVQVSPQVEIYIVASIAGGAGSGTFLDMAFIARHVAPNARVIGIFVLPDAFYEKVKNDSEQQVRMRANAYAALKEIQAHQDLAIGTPRSVVCNRSGATIELQDGVRLFDRSYLIDFKNQLGKRLSRTEDVYDMIGRMLLHDIGSPFRGYAASSLRNAATAQGVAICPKTNLKRTFSTFSYTALRFPVQQILEFCTISTLHALTNDVLLGAPMSSAARNAATQSFLDAHQLNELGRNDQVLNRLLTSPRNNEVLSATSEGLPTTFGLKLKPAEFSNQIRAKLAAFENETLPRVRQLIRDNAASYLGQGEESPRPIEQWLEAALAEWLQRGGGLSARDVLASLQSAFDEQKTEMVSENDAWRRSERSAQDELMTRALESLQKMSSVSRWWSEQDDRLKRQAIDAFNQIVAEELRCVARESASRIFQEARGAVLGLADRVSTHIDYCQRFARNLDVQLGRIRTEARRQVKAFVVEMDVTDASFLDEYFQSHQIDPKALYAEVQRRWQESNPEAAGQPQAFPLAILAHDEVGLSRRFTASVSSQYRPALMQTSVADFIAKNSEKQAFLKVKLGQLFDMCQPFWLSTLPQAGMRFDEVMALCCAPLPAAAGKPAEFPQEVVQWKNTHTEIALELLPTKAPYEMVLVRHTHGARPFYLVEDVATWKFSYEQALQQNAYPLHLDPRLADAPDLIPDEQRLGKQAFALGMALGFIAKRGDDYSLNLLLTGADPGAVDAQFRVPKSSEWETVFGKLDSAEAALSASNGYITYEYDKKAPLKKMLLASGRAEASAALASSDANMALIKGALSRWTAAVGSDQAQKLLQSYTEDAFASSTRNPATKKQLALERTLILEYLASL